MESDGVNYCRRIKQEASNKLVGNGTRASRTKYVFRPEVVSSLPKYSHRQVSCELESGNKESWKNGGSNGLRSVLGRVVRYSSESNKSHERNPIGPERRRSRSLFLAHDHSKDSLRESEHRARTHSRRKITKSRTEELAGSRKERTEDARRSRTRSPEVGANEDSIGPPAVEPSRHRESSGTHRRADYLGTHCREECRENGKLLCSPKDSVARSSNHDDRQNNPRRGDRAGSDGGSLRNDYRGGNKNRAAEVVDREPSPRHRAMYNSQRHHSSERISRSLDPDDRGKSLARSLRRVDSPYPRPSDHVEDFSPSRNVTGLAYATHGKSSTCCRLTRDETAAAIGSDSSVIGTTKGCQNKCGDDCGDDGAVPAENNDEKSKPAIYESERASENNGDSGTPGVLYRSRSLPQLSIHDSGVASGNEHAPGRPTSRLVADLRQLLTLKQHYYPEGGWGWVIVVVGILVQILSHGIHGSAGVLVHQVQIRFAYQVNLQSGQSK